MNTHRRVIQPALYSAFEDWIRRSAGNVLPILSYPMRSDGLGSLMSVQYMSSHEYSKRSDSDVSPDRKHFSMVRNTYVWCV
ncbi:hypothetical protein BC629DRAFT_1542261 [Irpex lacteus]|nr:hypothetical protein BC629DRAFT_1542261 [Irpex lacteus]